MEQLQINFTPREERTPAPCAKDAPSGAIRIGLEGRVGRLRKQRQAHKDWARKRAQEQFGL